MAGRFRSSPVLVMIAVLATFVLASTVLSGEHPWDTDRNTHHSGGTGTPDSTVVVADSVKDTHVSGTAAEQGTVGVIDFLRRVVFQMARSYGEWYRSSGSSSTQSSRW
jgi:hypothetical protein